MAHTSGPRIRPATWIPSSLALLLALGWGTREVASGLKRPRRSRRRRSRSTRSK